MSAAIPSLDSDACYLALQTGDARFDGRFFTLAAQAESAGFRPCLRCRPEMAPAASAAWSTQEASSILAQQAAKLRRQTAHGIRLKASYRPPYDVAAMLAFLSQRAVPLVKSVDLQHWSYQRTMALQSNGQPLCGWVQARFVPAQCAVEFLLSERSACASTSRPRWRPSAWRRPGAAMLWCVHGIRWLAPRQRPICRPQPPLPRPNATPPYRESPYEN